MTDTDSTPITVPATGTYRIDPDRSTVHYSGKHMFGTGTVHATFGIVDGEIEVREPLTTSTATVTIDAASFTSDKARRDKDVRGRRLLDVATYPHIVFASDRLSETADGWLVTGTVTAHGTTVPVDVHVDRVGREDGGIRVHGRALQLDRTALGITGSRGMVGRYLDLELDAFALPA
jgi:polyisoprenoid-binding protein YceI